MNKNIDNIFEKLNLVPKKPGCYQMKNEFGEIIYVGKAKILYNRLRSYFVGSHDAKTTRMVQDVVDFEYIITSTEVEALLLEQNFIKEYRPKYNILLMDDKTYPFILLTTEEHPRLVMTRDLSKVRNRKKARLFGPFPNAKACRDTVEILNKVFPFRKCKNIPKKSCLYFDMKQCLAPCIKEINSADYAEYITMVTRFLNGYDHDFINLIESKMDEAANSMEFELAIEYREILNSLKELRSRQKMTLNDGVSRDVFGYYVFDDVVCVQIFHMRQGSIIERSGEVFDIVGNLDEILISYLHQFYTNTRNITPSEILIPYINDSNMLETLLESKITIPIKGLKKQLVDLVVENAKNNLDNIYKLKKIKISRTTEPLEELGQLLDIPYPKVIEIFDNSNIQGVSSVSAMVCYVDGMPSKKDYRKYKIKTVKQADDYHTMQEVINRRYSRLKKENRPMPNLIIVDGGKPQVSAAKIILEKLSLDIPLMGLLKDDNHRTKGIITKDFQEIILNKKSKIFLLMEAMQDEVHRFAITYFKQTHSKTMLTSALDGIEGIGKNRKRVLIENFDNIFDIAHTTPERLKALGIPNALAIKIIETLKNRDQS